MATQVDPRPQVQIRDGQVLVPGGRCPGCGLVTVADTDFCPLCQSVLDEAAFGPQGTVWAATVLHVGVPGHEPPYAIAYVILDEGPRVLTHTPGAQALRVGGRVRLTGLDESGDLHVEPVEPVEPAEPNEVSA